MISAGKRWRFYETAAVDAGTWLTISSYSFPELT
jgi:hypothetical protein